MRKVSKLILVGVFLCMFILLVAAVVLVFGKIDHTVEADGMVVPAIQIGVSPELSGIIEAFYFKSGDRVQAGDTILLLASDELRYEAERAGLAVAEATVLLMELEEEYSNLTTSESFEGSAVLGDINAARKRMELAEASLERAEKLWKDNLLSTEERDAAQLNYDLALSNYRVLEARKNMLAKQYVRRIEERRSALDLVRKACELAQQRLRKTTVVSPVSGTILTPDTDRLVGTLASEGKPVVQIGDMSVMQFVANISETDIPDVAVGLSSRIFINAYPHREYKVFTGRVVEIAAAPQVTSAGVVFETRLDIDDPWVEHSTSRIDLKPGLSGRAEIIIEPDVRIIDLVLNGIAR